MKRRQDSNYHRVLRVAAVVCAVVLLFESGLVSTSTKQIAYQANWYVANAIGMSAAVQPTELNQYTAELTKRQRELDEREAALAEREIAVNLSTGSATNDTATYIIASILFILLVLILLNYTLDYLRAREDRKPQTV